KTPFIIFWPTAIGENGANCSSLISAIDIAPTILKLAGLQIPEQFQGISFDELIKDPAKEHRSYVFAEHNWHDYEAHERMLRTKNFMYILNSRPNLPASGPADAVQSPSYADLVKLKTEGQLSVIQADVFITPRPHEEFYNCSTDPLQLLNIAAVPEYLPELEKHQDILMLWMKETGDDFPVDLTKGWYEYLPGYIKAPEFGIRGEMPGSKSDAIKINTKSFNK
ncbi:MAG: hypothetical protein P1P88_12155, partial [Bacteroidales bacterium]|nr:hypothetical protein [Bacteroidales bacterium]